MALIKGFRDVPPGGWRYVQPETGVRFYSDTFEELFSQVRVHRAYKGFPTDTLSEDIQRQLCTGLTPEHCKAEEGEDYRPVVDVTSSLTTEMALSVSKAIVAFLATGGEFVDKGEAERRAAICRGCPFNKPAKLCSCSFAYKAIESLIPADRRHPGISVCMVCGCSLQAKANLPLSVIAASLPAGMQLPSWCWQQEARHPLESSPA